MIRVVMRVYYLDRGGGEGGIWGYYLISKLNAVSNRIMNGYLAVEDEF